MSIGRGLGAEIFFFFFFKFSSQIYIILSLLAYAECRLATIFDFELSHKKSVSK